MNMILPEVLQNLSIISENFTEFIDNVRIKQALQTYSQYIIGKAPRALARLKERVVRDALGAGILR